jgi:hypothetical protein
VNARFDESENGSGFRLVAIALLAPLAVQYTLALAQEERRTGRQRRRCLPGDAGTAYLAATAVGAGFTLLWAATSRSRRDLYNARPVSEADDQILERKYWSP